MWLRMEARAGTNERRQRKWEPPFPDCDLYMCLSEFSHRGKRLFRTMLNTLFFLYKSGFKIFATYSSVQFGSVQLLSYVRLFATPWTAACQAPHPSPTPGVYSNSCSLSWWCLPSNHIILCHPFLLPPSLFPSIRVFSNESVLHIRWPKYWSPSISPSNEYSGLISFRMDWLHLLAVQGTQESSPTPQFKSINSLVLSFLYSPTLTFIHDYWKNHSFD